MSKTRITEDMLRQIMPYSTAINRRKAIVALNDTAQAYNINTQKRVAAWLATIAIESGSLKYQEEIASGAAYEGRRDLGNTQPGDGRRFKGHGRIQITGRKNHQEYTDYLRKSKHLPFVDFVQNPKKLAEEPYATDAAGWFVAIYKNCNQLADKGDFLAYSIKVNGRNKNTGLPNHWAERNAVYQRALRVIPKNFSLDLSAGAKTVESVVPKDESSPQPPAKDERIETTTSTSTPGATGGTEVTTSEVSETAGVVVSTTVEEKNQQDVNQTATVVGARPYNDIGFIPTIKRDLAAVLGGNFGFEGVQTLLQHFTNVPEWLAGLLVKLGIVLIVGGVLYLLFRIIHYIIFRINENKRVEVQTVANTDINRKDVEFV